MRKYNGCNCRYNKTKEKPVHVGTSPHVSEVGAVQIVALVTRNTGYRLHPSNFEVRHPRCFSQITKSPFHSTTSMSITATAHSPVLPHIEANKDAAFVLLIPHHTPRSSQSATHRELHPRALLLISSS